MNILMHCLNSFVSYQLLATSFKLSFSEQGFYTSTPGLCRTGRNDLYPYCSLQKDLYSERNEFTGLVMAARRVWKLMAPKVTTSVSNAEARKVSHFISVL